MKHLMMVVVILLLFSCKKETTQHPPSTLTQQKLIPFCGVADHTLAGLRNKVQSVLSVSTDFVIYVSMKGGKYAGGIWGPAFTYTTSVGASLIHPADTLALLNAVREDYSAWKVAVTTDSNLYNSHTVSNRTKIICAPNLTSVIGLSPAGGYANIGSIIPGYEEPAIVFPDNLSYVINSIQEALSHEAGHTIGFYHQADVTGCTLNNGYWYGLGTGPTSWAPTMGVGYNKGLTTWASGLTGIYDDATSCFDVTQNEFTFMSSVIAKKSDAEPDNQFTGFTQAIPLGTVGLTKYFEKQGDADCFYLPYSATPRTLTIKTYGNIDVKADLYYINTIAQRNVKVYSFTNGGSQTGIGPVSFDMPLYNTLNNSRMIVIKSDSLNANVPNRNYYLGEYTVTVN